MRSLSLLGLTLLLSACGQAETFSPNYADNVCKPANAVVLAPLSSTASTTACCPNSWVATCCLGGNYVCADGTAGAGDCNCPTR